MIYELRIYRFHAGKKKQFLENFKLARKFMKKYGVTFVAAWESEEKDEFIWIRSFANTKARDKALEAYYGSPEWLKIVNLIKPKITRREVKIMNKIA